MSETEQGANLNITDIADAVKIIDYASEQGAFRGWDNIRQIMSVRDRLHSFVSAAITAAGGEDKADEQDPDHEVVENDVSNKGESKEELKDDLNKDEMKPRLRRPTS